MRILRASWNGITPYKWQPKFFREFRKEYSKDKPENCILYAVTGSGKTACMAEVCNRIELEKNQVIAITCNTVYLVEQTYKVLNQKMRGNVGRYYFEKKDIKPVTVVTNKSFSRFLEDLKNSNKELILVNVDEAHLSEGILFKEALKTCGAPLLGYTATPYRTEKKERLTLFTKCIFKYTVAQAIRDGTIVEWIIRHNDTDGETNAEICLKMIQGAKGSGVVNAENVDDAIKFTNYLRRNGIKAETVHYKVRSKEKIRIIEAFSENKIDVLVHVDMLKDGVDFPFIMWSLLRRNVDSKVRFIQEIGRPLRVFKNKNKAVFYDPNDQFGKFSITSQEVLGEIVEEERTKLLKVNFSEFEYFYDTSSYKVMLAIESLIRNIHVKFNLVGVKIQRNKSRTTVTKNSQQILLRELQTIEIEDIKWKRFLTVVENKINEIRSNYCWCLIRILRAIKSLNIYPDFDKTKETIVFTKEQLDIIEVINRTKSIRYLSYEGKKQSLKKWSKEKKISLTTLMYRYDSKNFTDKEVIEGKNDISERQKLLGKTFGNWKVIKINNNAYFKCICQCKKQVTKSFQAQDIIDCVARGCRQCESGVLSIFTPQQIKEKNKLLKKYKLKLKDEIDLDVCMMSECKHKSKIRGFCATHHQFINKKGLINNVALPKTNKRFSELDLKLDEKESKLCKVIEGDEKCVFVPHSAGMCKRHYDLCRRNNALLDFGVKKKSMAYGIASSASFEKCRIIEDYKRCERNIHGRGLCSKHYGRFVKSKCLDKYALPSTKT